MHHVLIGEVIPAAPAVPAVLTSLAGLFTILLWGVALALLLVWRRSFGALLLGLADEMDKVSVRTPFGRVHPLGVLSAWLRAVNYLIENGLSVSATGAEHAATFCFRWAGWFWHATALSIRFLAHDTAKALYGLTHHTIPRIVNATAAVLEHELHALPGQIRREARAAARPIQARVGRLEHQLEHDWEAIRREVARGLARLGKLERLTAREASRLSSLEKALGVAAFAAAVAVSLERFGLKWLRCPSFGRLGRKIGCGGFSLIEDVLFGVVEVFAVSDLCRFAGAITTTAEQIRPLLMEFVDVEEALIGCHGATRPPNLSVPALALPPTNAGMKLAA